MWIRWQPLRCWTRLCRCCLHNSVSCWICTSRLRSLLLSKSILMFHSRDCKLLNKSAVTSLATRTTVEPSGLLGASFQHFFLNFAHQVFAFSPRIFGIPTCVDRACVLTCYPDYSPVVGASPARCQGNTSVNNVRFLFLSFDVRLLILLHVVRLLTAVLHNSMDAQPSAEAALRIV